MTKPLLFFLLESAKAGLELQREDGSMPPGHNGPWNHVDTPVRTTSHWAILFSFAGNVANDHIFQNACKRCCDYLLSKSARPLGKAFFCRKEGGKDHTNNLIGQAWVIEALVDIGLQNTDESLLQCALDVAALHKFDKETNLWRRIEIDGTDKAYCWTLNQQIMFSAVILKLSILTNEYRLYNASNTFFNRFHEQLRWKSKGLPFHHINALNKANIFFRIGECLTGRWWNKLSFGYMPFVLYGLSLAKKWCPDQNFWQNGHIDRIVQEMLSLAIRNFPYGHLEARDSFRWAYNPAGFELALAIDFFKDKNQEKYRRYYNDLINLQIDGYYCNKRKLMCLNTFDPMTLSARIYEATRLQEVN